MNIHKELQEDNWTFYVKVASTTLFIIYWTLLAFYPLRPEFFWLQIIGSAGWVWAGWRWSEPTVMLMHGFVGVMSAISIFVY